MLSSSSSDISEYPTTFSIPHSLTRRQTVHLDASSMENISFQLNPKFLNSNKVN